LRLSVHRCSLTVTPSGRHLVDAMLLMIPGTTSAFEVTPLINI
jgi:hypothetical protein